MSDVQRICGHCGKSNALDARHCSHCGYDFQAVLPAGQTNLPVVLGQAALPVLVGAAGIAVRAGWRLLRSQWARETARSLVDVAANRLRQTAIEPAPKAEKAPPAKPQTTQPVRRARRTIRIRSSWAIGDANGVWRRGDSEHTIEIDD